VSFVDAAFGGLAWRTAGAYLPAQVTGCITGAIAANAMYGRAAVSISTHDRATGGHLLSEVVATLGLLLVIFALTRSRRGAYAAGAVGACIGAAYFFTSSTSFANPAITVGRMFSNTFAGIAPASARLHRRPSDRRDPRHRRHQGALPRAHSGRRRRSRRPPPGRACREIRPPLARRGR
jgi:arsenate reductase